jgi:phosphoribosylformimino-5-aminoimidazole carboxamide ribotide isomerase
MLMGPAFDLYQKILGQTDLKLIASGGVSSIEDLPRLAALGCEGSILGKAIYENRISLKALEHFIINSN